MRAVRPPPPRPAGVQAGADLGQDRGTQRRPFPRRASGSPGAQLGCQDRAPQVGLGAAAGQHDAGRLDPERAHPLEAVGEGEARRPRSAPDEMAAVVREAEADPGAARVRVHVRRALAGEVGQEQQPVRPGRHRRGALQQDRERVEALGREDRPRPPRSGRGTSSAPRRRRGSPPSGGSRRAPRRRTRSARPRGRSAASCCGRTACPRCRASRRRGPPRSARRRSRRRHCRRRRPPRACRPAGR